MKKLIVSLCLCAVCFFALAPEVDCVTLRTVSSFAGQDSSASTYARLLSQWEEKTGNSVQDASNASDETWKKRVLLDFAAGDEPDVLFFFTCTTDSVYLLNRVVPIAEINAAYPELQIPEDTACTEVDGKIYAVPVRSYWEGLFCNTDLFERYGVELPDTWEKFERAIAVFGDHGVVPVAISLSDVPHYILEFLILSCGGVEDYLARPAIGEPVPQSWVDSMALLKRLYDLGAFPENVNTTDENHTSQLFSSKQAAMQIDGSWFANGLPQTSMDNTVVIPFPAYAEPYDATIGGVSMGFYLTSRAWNDTEKRDAAVSLLAYLSTGDNARTLGGFSLSGRLLESANGLLEHPLLSPIQDSMSPAARSEWFSLVPSLVTGMVTPEEMWERVMALDPFGTQ